MSIYFCTLMKEAEDEHYLIEKVKLCSEIMQEYFDNEMGTNRYYSGFYQNGIIFELDFHLFNDFQKELKNLIPDINFLMAIWSLGYQARKRYY